MAHFDVLIAESYAAVCDHTMKPPASGYKNRQHFSFVHVAPFSFVWFQKNVFSTGSLLQEQLQQLEQEKNENGVTNKCLISCSCNSVAVTSLKSHKFYSQICIQFIFYGLLRHLLLEVPSVEIVFQVCVGYGMITYLFYTHTAIPSIFQPGEVNNTYISKL